MKIDNSPVRGSRDLLPGPVAVRDHVLATIAATYREFGYQRIETPALESIERLTAGQGGDNEKLIYQVLRRGLPERIDGPVVVRDLVDLGLRYDLTVPLSRFYGNNHASLPMPFRSFQFGPVWRAERPQRGRYRQFNQCDIDMIGEASVLAEAELIEATTRALNAVGLTGTTVRLSDRRFLAALAAAAGVPEDETGVFFVVLDKLDKIGWSGVRAELVERGFDAAAVDRAGDVVTALGDVAPDKLTGQLADALPAMDEAVLRDLDETIACLRAVGEAGNVGWTFDPTLVRGMGYYTGQIFEIAHPDMPGSIAGGGRYDGLIGRALGKPVPACGFSIGFERIVELVTPPQEGHALVLLHDADVPAPAVLAAARELRAGGRPVAVVRRQGKFAAQLTRLEGWGFTSFVALRADGQSEERPLRGPGAG